MEWMDILFVGIGLLCVAASFFLPERLANNSKKEEQRAADLKEAVLAELRKKENLDRIVTDALAELSGRMREQKNELLLDSEAELDRMSNEKMIAFGEYADELLEKINQDHSEVVFLYDMLKEKESTLKDFAARLEGTNQQIQRVLLEAEEENTKLGSIYQQVQMLTKQAETAVERYEEIRRKQEVQAEARRLAQAQARMERQAKEALRETAAGTDTGTEERPVRRSSQPVRMQPVRTQEARTQPARKREPLPAVSQPEGQPQQRQTSPEPREIREIRETGEREPRTVARRRTGNPRPLPPVRKEEESLEPIAEKKDESVLLEEQNERILRMYRGGMSILEISKMMGLGQGEVKLVVDLFHKAR